ncbi:SRPBCC family protein [Solwaraspora sp. WMMD406]|uniref:SRPBCC family protein n=1 Tax=Solwaraspora sp. WMMD406 TaxID=3016095 RepID=UPI0024172DBE|nr:SRPBCC family protein [Solwaraspora sp. WMMD406]MDG4767600.1 SRPBCC family protein [Solwaraspora sp. WMMD406]
MRTETFTDEFTVAAPPERVYAHLAEPTNHIGLSPLIVAVRDVVAETDDAGRAVLRYVAVERFTIAGPLRYDNVLRVRQTATVPGRELVLEVRSPAWVSVRFVMTVAPHHTGPAATSPAATGSRVTVTVRLRMPTLLRSYVVRTARRVQVFRARTLTERMSD